MATRSERRATIDTELRPPEPQLLDTCVLQNLDWIDRQLASKNKVVWDDEAIAALAAKYGEYHANDLIDLGTLYKQFEWDGGYPWLVCQANSSEAAPLGGITGVGLRDIISFFDGHQDQLISDAFPGVALGLLGEIGTARISPLLLRGLGVSSVDQVFSAEGPLAFLQDDGDRQIAGCALLANIPAILTTDRKTFWRHRELLRPFGVEVFRPSELLTRYDAYWTALSDESAPPAA